MSSESPHGRASSLFIPGKHLLVPVGTDDQASLVEQDAHLIAQAKVGDESAFTKWFDSNKDQILRFVRWKLNHSGLSSEAEDVAYEAIIKAWQKINSFRGNGSSEGSFLRWVIAIASRKCLDLQRKKGIRSTTVDADLVEVLLDETAAVDAYEVLITEEERRILRAAMARLARIEKEIILKFLEGFTGPEVAQAVAMTVHQVNGIKFRALLKLKEHVKK